MIQLYSVSLAIYRLFFAFFTLKLSFFSGTHMPDHHTINLRYRHGTADDHYHCIRNVLRSSLFFYTRKGLYTAAMYCGNVLVLLLLYLYYREVLQFSQALLYYAAMHLVIIPFFIFLLPRE
jgi:hypothetical protein